MTEPGITREVADAIIAKGSDLRVTPERIKAKITSVEYVIRGTTTHAFLYIDNDFVIHGEAGCVDPANFNKEVGERYAYDDGFRKLWPLMGWHLAELKLLRKQNQE